MGSPLRPALGPYCKSVKGRQSAGPLLLFPFELRYRTVEHFHVIPCLVHAHRHYIAKNEGGTGGGWCGGGVARGAHASLAHTLFERKITVASKGGCLGESRRCSAPFLPKRQITTVKDLVGSTNTYGLASGSWWL